MPQCTFLDVPHSDYPDIYSKSKIFASFSRQEGGPISWLEAMASGCITLSTPTGFPLELASGNLYSYIYPFSLLLSNGASDSSTFRV